MQAQPLAISKIIAACGMVLAATLADPLLNALLLPGLLLFLPLLDRTWQLSATRPYAFGQTLRSVSFAAVVVLLLVKPDYLWLSLSTLLLSALPEEWFFRTWLMQKLNDQFLLNRCTATRAAICANLATAAFFAALHVPSQGLFGLLVFLPALFYGWLYQRTQDLVLLILLHTLSNMVFFMFIENDLLRALL